MDRTRAEIEEILWRFEWDRILREIIELLREQPPAKAGGFPLHRRLREAPACADDRD